MNIALMNRLLRSPADVARDCKEDRDVAAVAASAILAIALGAVLFGAAVGSWRGSAHLRWGREFPRRRRLKHSCVAS